MTAQNDALAALGLDVTEETAPVVSETAKPALTVVPASTDAVDRSEVDVGEIEIGFIDFIPATKRGGGGNSGSKYKFDSLEAPAVNAETGKTNYSFFKVLVGTNDEKKLQRSVQSATTQQNATNKKAGDETTYFITRTALNKEGKLEAMLVIRTDARPAVEEADEASSEA